MKSKQYPRHCTDCGEIAVQRTSIPYDAQVKHDGKLHQFPIPALVIDECTSCGEQFFTNSTDDQISASLRSHLGLLQPDEIRLQLETLGLTQKEFAEHLRVAQESVSRWLTGATIQSRSLDTLMRVYFRFPDVRQALKSTVGLAIEGTLPPMAPVAGHFVPHVVDKTLWVPLDDAMAHEPIQHRFARRFSSEQLARSSSFDLMPSLN